MISNKPNLWIFGDSYCDKNFRNDLSYEGWPALIEKEYNVTNMSKTGSGPDYSLQKLVDMLKKTDPKIRKRTHVFFGISDIFRIPMQFCNPPHRNNSLESLLVMHMMYKFRWLEPKNVAKTKKLLSKYFTKKELNFIEKVYRENILYSSYSATELVKIIGFLKEVSKEFKTVCVVPLFNTLPYYLQPIENTENFLVMPDAAIEVFPNDTGFGEDPKNNHLPKHVHQKLVDAFWKWTNERQPFELKDFL